MRVAVVGCGLIGRRRAEVARRLGDEIALVADADPSRAAALAREVGAEPAASWEAAVTGADVDAVVVATTHRWLAPIAVAALGQGRHVLVEKPLGRHPDEAEQVVRAAAGRGLAVGVGFNHRYHPGLWRAHELLGEGAIGEPLYVRCRYGHGGRPGYEREWRMDRELSGGGELLDQGIHAIDLSRWFLGEFAEAFGYTATYVWGAAGQPAGAPVDTATSPAPPRAVEDNGFALYRTAAGQVASLHASWTQWRNTFAFELYGRDGYLAVEGLGGSYGPERLTWGWRRPEGGPPDEQRWEFAGADASWEAEWREFQAAVREGRQPLADATAGWQALRLVHAVYESARTGRVVRL